uniref:Glycosyltransferase family 9 protein n=1 Tax=Desulfobacca acetoxidans TaxID=60893 RepID=A0A7C3SLA1_9BACT
MSFSRACAEAGYDMEILVVNLMRLGDLLQASPVLRRLRAEYPGSHLILLAMDVFKEPALLLEGVDCFRWFPSTILAAALEGKENWPEAFCRLSAWLNHEIYPSPDLVINLSPTVLGATLSFLVSGGEVRGFTMDSGRQGYTWPSWASYAMVVSNARTANPFNLVDLFVRGAGLTPDGAGLRVKIPPEDQAQADKSIEALGLASGTARVGLFPGASRPERQWPAENFAQTALIMRDRRPCHFFIFGSPPERGLGEAIGSRLPAAEVTNFQGQTSVPGLAAHLQRLDLLITNDTGPMHLAAAVGARVLGLFLATARVQDTGPAGRGHIAIEPELPCHPCVAPCASPRCHAAIDPAQVAALGLGLLEKDSHHRRGKASNLRIYRSDIDPSGYQAYLPMPGTRLSKRIFWTWVHRLAWSQALDSQEACPETMASWVRQALRAHFPGVLEDLGLAAGRRALGELLEVAAWGESVARRVSRLADRGAAAPLEPELKAFAMVDQHLHRLAVQFPEIAAIIEFFFQEQRKPTESGVKPLAHELARAYKELQKLGEIFLKVAQDLASGLSPTSGKKATKERRKDPRRLRNQASEREWQNASDYQ